MEIFARSFEENTELSFLSFWVGQVKTDNLVVLLLCSKWTVFLGAVFYPLQDRHEQNGHVTATAFTFRHE